MNIVMFDGIMGSGKTLGATIMAYDLMQRSNCTLYSNFGMKGAKPFTHLNDFVDVAKQQSSVIVLDESHIDIDSRNFSQNSVKFFVQLVFYMRKIRCSLFLTSPLFRNIDTRVQDVTNIYIPVRNDYTHFIYPMYDWQSKQFRKEKRIKHDVAKRLGAELMDTNAIVTPLEYPDSRNDFNILLETIKQENARFNLSKAI